MRIKTVISALAITGLVFGCGSKGDEADATSETNQTGDDTTGGGGEESSTSGDDQSETGPGEETADPDTTMGIGFIGGTEMGGVNIECSVWNQDCPENEKCMPWANDGGNSWNATKCTPLDPNAAQPGDSCTVEGSGVSGVDDCAKASMCWDVDPETNTGVCVAFCSGSEAEPFCDDPEAKCTIVNDGTLILCIPTCDPVIQDCEAKGFDADTGCIPSDDQFVCVFVAAGPDEGNYGDPCEFANVCQPGLFCANAAGVPNCQGAQGCCSEFCDFSDPNATMGCAGFAGGQECLAWYAEGEAPPGLEDVGACATPMG